MTETVQAVDPPQTNGIDAMDDDERAKIRPADIDADVKEMERRKRVENIMNSKMFREELERIIETQMNEGTGTNSLMQQISDMMGVNKQAGNFYKNSSCVVPINDIRGIEAMSYGKGEKILRCKLAAIYRLIDLCGWNQGTASLITARLNQDEEHFLVNPYGMLYHEITASSLIKVDMQANVVEQGTTNFSVNISAFSLHGAIHAARPDIKCIIHLHTPSVVAVSATKMGILPISQESVVIGEVSTHHFLGGSIDPEEKDKLARNLGPNNKVLLLTNKGVLCCGETIEEAFFNARNTVLACEAQLKLLPIGLDNIMLLNDETRKRIYEAAHKPPESTPRPDKPTILDGKVERKWRVGGVEFEGLMRMLDNVGFRTGYIYRHPLIKGDVPKPKNDVEVPPAVSSLGYLLEEEELYKKGLWRHLGEGKKGQNRSRWLNSPNVYQRVEFLETGTQDPKKITKWIAEGSPTHASTPVKIESALQFVPKNTNPREFKQKQQQIKDNRRADKISAGPQSNILETVSWEEAKKMQTESANQCGDQVVLMGAASKGIIQRGHQHNVMVYKSPYAKNPFDSVTDEELEEYKKVVEKKTKGDYDTDFSESELSSAGINKRLDGLHLRSPTSETEEESRDEPQVLRIETKQAPRPSQPEVVLSDGYRVLCLPDNIKEMNAYRTTNHFGLPKGSYLIPNPVHYHLAHKRQICKLSRPRLTTLSSFNRSSGYMLKRNVRNTVDPLVTVNFGNSHSLSLNIPTNVLRGFILPFANALNMVQLPTLNTQSSQTAYMNNFQRVPPNLSELSRNYTPLRADSMSVNYRKFARRTMSFEAQILEEMKDKITDMSLDSETSTSHASENDEKQPENDHIETPANKTVFPQVSSESSTTAMTNENKSSELSSKSISSQDAITSNNEESECSHLDTHFTSEVYVEQIFSENLDFERNTSTPNVQNEQLIVEIMNGTLQEIEGTIRDFVDSKSHSSNDVNSSKDLEEEDDEDDVSADDVMGVYVGDMQLTPNQSMEDKDDHKEKQDLKSGEIADTDIDMNRSPTPNMDDKEIEKDIDYFDLTSYMNNGHDVISVLPSSKFLEMNVNNDEYQSLIQVDANFYNDVQEANNEQYQNLIHDDEEVNDVAGSNSYLNIGYISSPKSNESLSEQIHQEDDEDQGEEDENIYYNDDMELCDDINNDTFIICGSEANTKSCNTYVIDEEEEEKDEKETYKQNITLKTALSCNQNTRPFENEDKKCTTFGYVDFDQMSIDLEEMIEKEDDGSPDEGIVVLTPKMPKKSPTKPRVTFNEHIKKLSEAIYDYLQQQCFEIRELVLFPEVLYDPNLNKLLAKLKTMYDEFYSSGLSAEEKNDLRASISANLLNQLENDGSLNVESSNDSSTVNIISDKIFTITEFVSDILDNFFSLIAISTCVVVKEDSNGENFLEFTQRFRDTNGNLLHSTPESPTKLNQSDEEVKTPERIENHVEVISFKRDKSKKSGGEAYWITCKTSPQTFRNSPMTNRRIINVDDIPLRPPEDFLNITPSNRNLYLIPEEPRCNLFGVNDEDEVDTKIGEPPDHQTNLNITDMLAGGDGSYVSFDKPEVNIVLHNEVSFLRVNTINSSSYVKADSITLQKSVIVEEEESNESFYSANERSGRMGEDCGEGDWMGYEMAKF